MRKKLKRKILKILAVMFFLIPTIVNAGSGCCSHHDGQSYCGSNGKWICSDGWQSSCSCSKNDYSSSSSNSGANSNYNYSSSTSSSETGSAIAVILFLFVPIIGSVAYGYIKNSNDNKKISDIKERNYNLYYDLINSKTKGKYKRIISSYKEYFDAERNYSFKNNYGDFKVEMRSFYHVVPNQINVLIAINDLIILYNYFSSFKSRKKSCGIYLDSSVDIKIYNNEIYHVSKYGLYDNKSLKEFYEITFDKIKEKYLELENEKEFYNIVNQFIGRELYKTNIVNKDKVIISYIIENKNFFNDVEL